MFDLTKKGVAISATAGFATGLIVATVLWHESPKASPLQQNVSLTAKAALVQPTVVGDPEPEPNPLGLERPDPEQTVPVHALDIGQAKAANGRLVQDLGEGRSVEFTVMPAVQKVAQHVLESADVPFGALVAMEPSTGRVLAYASHSSVRPELKNLPGLANPPAANVFKVISTAALLEHGRIAPDYQVCFNGGRQGINLKHLEDDAKRDRKCHTVTEALGKSTNAVFGKLADRYVPSDVLDRYARKFGWKRDIPFLLPVQPSAAVFSTDRLTHARTAAGFYNTQMSPVHAAMVAATIGNRGVMMAPKLVERYSIDGETMYVRHATPMGRSILPTTAKTLSDMMVATTELGTARKYFSKRNKYLKGIRVAAKTGSLSAEAPDGQRHHFSWWIGFAPAENPRIAVAALVVNTAKWRIKSSYLARETLEAYFQAVVAQDISAR